MRKIGRPKRGVIAQFYDMIEVQRGEGKTLPPFKTGFQIGKQAVHRRDCDGNLFLGLVRQRA